MPSTFSDEGVARTASCLLLDSKHSGVGPKMKILMISGVYYPKINGAVVAVSNMINSLSARGHRVTLVTRREKGSPRVENMNGVRIVRVGNPGFKLSSRIAL